MAKSGPLLIVGVILLAGGAAWLALSGDPGSDSSPEAAHSSGEVVAPVASDDSGRSHVGVGENGPAPIGARSGAIRVVEADGSPATARVYTTSEPTYSHTSRRFVGRTAMDGVILPEARGAEPLAFLWALAPGRIAGPVEVRAAGQTLTLGPGSSIEVHVRRPDGTPIAGASCDTKPWRAHAVTDVNGDALLSGLAAGSVEEVGARVVGAYGRATAEISLPSDGTQLRVELEVDPGGGPFVLVAIAGDVTATDEVRIDIARGKQRARNFIVYGGDPPTLVSLRSRADSPVQFTARSLGYRSAERHVEYVDRGTTARIELRLVAGGVPLRGRVLNADGSPAARVVVGTAKELLGYGAEVTDEDGGFDVQIEWIGAAILALREREACSAEVTLRGDDLDELTLRLGTGAVLQGIVRDETSGRPIEKAEVRIAFGSGEYDDEWTAITDVSGAYRVAGLPPGTFVLPLVEGSPRAIPIEGQWRLTGGHHRSAPNPERLIADGHAYRIAGTETIAHDLTATALRGGECTVHVVLPARTELPDHFDIEHSSKGARGWGEELGFERPKDGQPSFTLFLEEGTHSLRVLVPGLVGEGAEIVVSGDGPLPDVEIVMTQRRRVLARIVDANGAPVALEGVRIRVAITGPSRGGSHGEGITVANGVADITDDSPAPGKVDADDTFVVFTLDGEGVYGVSPWGEEANLRIPGREWARRVREESAVPWMIDVPIITPPTTILRVVNAAGRPVADVPVQWKQSFESEWTSGVSDASGAIEVALTDELNQFEFQATGDWVGGTDAQQPNSRTEETTLTVDRRRTLRVRFVDPTGNALTDQWVIAFVPGVWTERATDEAGFIDLDLAASETTFQVRARGYWPPKSVAAPADATEVDAVIEPLFPVTFHVLLPPDLKPPDRVFVQVGTSRWPNGDAAFADVVPGAPIEAKIMLPRRAFPVSVSVGKPLFGGTAHYTGGENDVTVRIERLPLRRVVLRLTDDDGHPIAGTLVRARAHAVFDTELMTDADGHVTIDVPPIALNPVVITAEGYEETGWSFDPNADVDGPVTIRLKPIR